MPIVANRSYHDPAIGQAFANLAQIFAPPSAQDLASYETANGKRQQNEIIRRLASDPKYSGFDHQGILAGLFTPTQSFHKVETDAATARYGHDMSHRAAVDVAGINNAGAMERQNASPVLVNENQTAFLPAQTQGATGLPATLSGNINVAPGEVSHTPMGNIITGTPKPLTETEWIAAQNERLRSEGLLGDQDLIDILMGQRTPVQALGQDGNPVFMSPGAAVRTGATPAPSTGGGAAAEAQINRLTQQFIDTGLTTSPAEARNMAIGIVDNRYTVSRHPVTGEALVLDVATGLPVSRAPKGETPTSTPAVDQQGQMTDQPFGSRYQAAPEAFGVGGAVAGGVNSVFDALGVGAPYPDVQQTQSDFAVLRESLINDIGNAYSRQPPSWLLKNIEALTPQAGSPFEGTGTAQTKLNAIGRQLTDELRTTERTLQGQLSPTNRQEVEIRAVGLRTAIDRVTDALQSFGGVDERVQPSPAEPTIAEGQTATNPATGQRLIYRNGQWEPI